MKQVQVQVQVKKRTHTLNTEQVRRYHAWLSAESQRTATSTTIKDIDEYSVYARKAVTLDGKRIQAFAPFRREHSAFKTFSTTQIVTISAIALALLLGFAWLGISMLAIIVALIICIYLGNLLLDAHVFLRALGHASEEQIDDEIVDSLKDASWPSYTILCPLYHETRVVSQFVRAMKEIDYPVDKLQILLLTEEDDTETRGLLQLLPLPAHFHIVTVPEGSPRTKPRACNYGLLQATGSYIVIYDAEDIPDPLQLKKAVLTFANYGPELACVQAKLNFYNTNQNLLTRWFTAEYSTWFDMALPGLQQIGFALPLGGTSNHFRADVLRALGGWDVFNVTEDCDLGLRLARYHLQTVVLDSTTREEANSQIKNWLRQRSRWIKGYMQTYLVHERQSFQYLRTGSWREFLSLQVVVGNRTSLLFFNPFMWILLAVYIAFQPLVVNTYHLLFPPLILYSGAFCLIFGNFFYVYLYLLACVKRKQYALVKWTLLIPFYWALISVAGFLALFELIVKPHYWQKTIHGLHLQDQLVLSPPPTVITEEAKPAIVSTPVSATPQSINSAIALDTINYEDTNIDAPSITTSLKAIATLPVPVISSAQKIARRTSKHYKVRDLWFVATIALTCVMSLAATIYYFQNHEILLYGDALSHLRIARRVFESATPGIAQFGGIWLPLQHILVIPFVWNDFLWRTGLAGSIVSMLCYSISAIYLYLSARRLNVKGPLNFLGAIAFLCNPNVLYLQTTPLTELLCIATSTVSCYYFLVWVQSDKRRYLVLAAASTFFATLARYDGWALFLALLALILVIGWMKHQKRSEIESNILTFGILGGLGIILWLLWNLIIFGDPFYFQHSQFSAQAQQQVFIRGDLLETYHNLWQALRYYTIDSVSTFGVISSSLVCVSIVVFLLQRRFRPETLAVLIFFMPFAFYVTSLYTGQAIIWIPGAAPAHASNQFFNARYGAQMVLPASLFLVLLANTIFTRLKGHVQLLANAAFLLLILTQAIVVASNGIVAFQDGEYGLSCYAAQPLDFYFAQHYNQGRILVDTFSSNFDEAEDGIDLTNTIYDGSGPLWHQALRDPASVVDWVIAKPRDLVSMHLNVKSAAFLQQFTPVLKEPGGLTLFHKKDLSPLPTRTLQVHFLSGHSLCGTAWKQV
jgi:cellulose synthase/poly-beta-1,6-N-acetylglucosamine synthase-like glycosyltransferase